MLLSKKRIWMIQALTAVAAFSSGCGAVKDAQDSIHNVAKTTQDVSDTSKDLDAKTTEVRDTSKELDRKTGELDDKTTILVKKTGDLYDLTSDVDYAAIETYYKLRQGNSGDARLKYYDSLTAKLRSGDDVGKQKSKIADATAYLFGFEFQLWDGKRLDTQDYLDQLYLLALEEFSRKLSPYVPADYKVDPTRTDNDAMILDAIAVSMHKKNPLQAPQKLSQNDDAKQISMYDLLAHGLRMEKARNDGKVPDSQEKEWEAEVARNKNDRMFTYLMQVRMNYLPVMMLAQVSKIAQDGFLGIPGLFRKVNMMFQDWTADISSVDEMYYYLRWFEEDGDGFFPTRQLLKDIGANVELNGNVRRILSHMKIDESKLQPACKQKNDKGVSPLDRLKNDIQRMLTGN